MTRREQPMATVAGPHRRRVGAAFLVAVAIAGVITAAWQPWRGHYHGVTGSGVYSPFLGTVSRRTLIEQTPVSATLGYAGTYSVVNQTQGIYTGLPAVGQVIDQGQVAYKVSGAPVALLYGSVPAWRDMSEGENGPDVAELNADLVTLGYAKAAELDPSSDYFGAETGYALDRLQAHLGVRQTGILSLGQAVFLPSAPRVTALQVTLGTAAAPSTQVLTATSTTPQVSIELDAGLQSDVKAGDTVAITLPDQQTTPGVVTSVSSVATSASSGAGGTGSAGSPGSGGPAGSTGSSAGASIAVYVSLLNPGAVGGLDAAPVEALITTGRASDVLAVPVTALLATTKGYQVQVGDPGGHYRFLPVTVGLFDDSAGLVQVTGQGLHAGERVVEAQA
jgi:Putative peptidoglycan binding domain